MSNFQKYATNRNLIAACIAFGVLVFAIFNQVHIENVQDAAILALLKKEATEPQNLSVANLTFVLPSNTSVDLASGKISSGNGPIVIENK